PLAAHMKHVAVSGLPTESDRCRLRTLRPTASSIHTAAQARLFDASKYSLSLPPNSLFSYSPHGLSARPTQGYTRAHHGARRQPDDDTPLWDEKATGDH